MTEGELKELDATELQQLLKAYEDIDAAEILFGSDQGPEDQPMSYCSPGSPQTLEIKEEVLEYSEASQRKDSSVLLITIPEQMNTDPAFDCITSISLERRTLNKIADASAGHDGVYLPINQLSGADDMIIRRPPLRIIEHNSLTIEVAEVAPQKVESGKRKQTFKLTRDDRVEFSFYEHRLRPKETLRAPTSCFQWASTDEDTDDAIEAAEEPSRCAFCKKLFKKLDQHRCKKMLPVAGLKLEPTTQDVDGISMMFCATCHRPYKSKKGLVAHMKKCNAEQAVDGSQPEKSAQKRSLRSRVKK